MSNIKQYFSKKTVFITGATGFIGQLLLEKLLRTCTEIEKVYVLMREKKGKSIESRMEELLANTVFSELKKISPNFSQKICLVMGDLLLENLGVKLEDEEKLLKEVQCVFHCAATVRFNEKIKTAAYINVRSTRDLLELSRKMQNLEVFVYVSTAYSNCPNEEIKEEVYEPPITERQLLTLVDNFKDGFLEKITPSLIGNWANNYVFSKCIAEAVVKSRGSGLPVAIVRPSIVISTYKEPKPGWATLSNSFIGLNAGIAAGIVHVLPCDNQKLANFIPADYVVNAIISVAWTVGSQKTSNLNSVKVFNLIGSSQEVLTTGSIFRYTEKEFQKVPCHSAIWYPFTLFCSSSIFLKPSIFVFHMLPAYIIDTLTHCIGKDSRLVEKYKKINRVILMVSHFGWHQWRFYTDNVQELWNKLNDADKELFCFDMRTFDWKPYLDVFVKGIRFYIIQDSSNSQQLFKKYLSLKGKL